MNSVLERPIWTEDEIRGKGLQMARGHLCKNHNNQQQGLMLTKLSARHYSKHFTRIDKFNPG